MALVSALKGPEKSPISDADFWPRYFFGLDIAIDQCTKWLNGHHEPQKIRFEWMSL